MRLDRHAALVKLVQRGRIYRVEVSDDHVGLKAESERRRRTTISSHHVWLSKSRKARAEACRRLERRRGEHDGRGWASWHAVRLSGCNNRGHFAGRSCTSMSASGRAQPATAYAIRCASKW